MPNPPKRGRGEHLTKDERARLQDAFLQAYADSGIILTAARHIGVDRRTIFDWREHDEAFAERFKIAQEDANDVLRAEIRRRGAEGWDEPVYQGGKLVGHTRKYSDTMLKMWAVARMPEFRDRMDVTSAGLSVAPAYEAIAKAAEDPDTAAIAGQLLERLAGYQQQ